MAMAIGAGVIRAYERAKEGEFEEQGIKFSLDDNENMEAKVPVEGMEPWDAVTFEIKKADAEAGEFLEFFSETPLIVHFRQLKLVVSASRRLAQYFGYDLGDEEAEPEVVTEGVDRDELTATRERLAIESEGRLIAEKRAERSEGKFEGVKEAMELLVEGRDIRIDA